MKKAARKKMNDIIVGVSGSVAAYKAVEIVRKLNKKENNVIVVMTKAATKFVSALTFQTVSNNSVFTPRHFFEGVHSKQKDEQISLHISLAQRASLILLVPATANIIAKIANGICDDLLTNVVIATKAKLLIAPAMNENMYTNSIVQENIERLKKRGCKIISPVIGDLTCGKQGMGHLASVKTIVEAVLNH